MRLFFQDAAAFDISSISREAPDVIVMDISSGSKEGLRICGLIKKDLATAYTPVITVVDKKHLRKELLELRYSVDDYIVSPLDPTELLVRAEIAVKRSQHSFYANPLTGLPGGIVIEEVLEDKLESGEPFVVGHVDIDNFKSFNDKYGYLKGDRAIMQTAYMLNVSARTWGNESDLIGHIGGDDFVIVTTPDKYNDFCRNFICMFDTIVPFHYADKDREKGYITVMDRTKKVRKKPLMSVTIALVLKTSPAEINTIIELNERIAEVKQYLKKMSGSKYMADRRITKKDGCLSLQMFRNDDAVVSRYKPLGHMLVEQDIITPEELDAALKEHWKRGVLLGEVLKEQKLVSEKELRLVLGLQTEGLDAVLRG